MENYINLDYLPRWRNNSLIDWSKCNDYELDFYFNGVSGKIKILNVINGYKLNVLYNKQEFLINKQSLIKCGLGEIVMVNKIIPYLYEIGEIIKNDNRDLIVLHRERRNRKDIKHSNESIRWYKCRCDICKTENAWINESHLKSGRGCPVCHSKQFDEVTISIPITAPWMIPYFQGGIEEAKQYTKSARKKIYFKCPDCGKIKEKEMTINKLYMMHSIGCPCGDGISYPNKFMFNLLKQLNIDFIAEYSPDWIKPKRYDFYFELDGKKYIVEMDGGLGHGVKSHPKSKLSKQETKDIDTYKDKIAENNGIHVIRIDSKLSELDYIRNNILNSELYKLIDIAKVNFSLCHEYALKNIVKLVCDYWSNNINATTSDVMKKFTIDRSTVCRYLHKGTNLGWCYYSGSYKPIEAFKDGVSIGKYKSAKNVSDNSINILGINISQESIKNVCRKSIDSCMGFYFEYIHK